MRLTVVGIGGSMPEDSQSQRALTVVLQGARLAGAQTLAITGTGRRSAAWPWRWAGKRR